MRYLLAAVLVLVLLGAGLMLLPRPAPASSACPYFQPIWESEEEAHRMTPHIFLGRAISRREFYEYFHYSPPEARFLVELVVEKVWRGIVPETMLVTDRFNMHPGEEYLVFTDDSNRLRQVAPCMLSKDAKFMDKAILDWPYGQPLSTVPSYPPVPDGDAFSWNWHIERAIDNRWDRWVPEQRRWWQKPPWQPPIPTPTWREFESCEDAERSGLARRIGEIGDGQGFRQRKVPSAPDDDGDGIVCEEISPLTDGSSGRPRPG